MQATTTLTNAAGETLEYGRARLVRHGYLPKREVMTGIEPLPGLCRVRVRDRKPGADKITFRARPESDQVRRAPAPGSSMSSGRRSMTWRESTLVRTISLIRAKAKIGMKNLLWLPPVVQDAALSACVASNTTPWHIAMPSGGRQPSHLAYNMRFLVQPCRLNPCLA